MLRAAIPMRLRTDPPAIYKQINIRKKSKNIPKKHSQKNAIIGFSFLIITYIIRKVTA